MKTLTVNDAGILITPAIKKYLAIIDSGKIEEKEIIAMKSLMGKNRDAAIVITDTLKNCNGLTLSTEQNEKGHSFLMNQWKTESGKERKNNPFCYPEQTILENFSHFTLIGFENIGKHPAFPFFIPLYSCYDKAGNSFDYYYNGKINIIR